MSAKKIQSLERALAVVHLLAAERRPLGVSEIAQGTGLPAATVHRILATLASRDWVEQDARGAKYGLGFGLLAAGASAVYYSPLIARARPVLDELSELSGFNVYLSTLQGSRVCYLARADGPEPRVTRFHLGLMHRAQATASGKVLLAALPDADLARLLASSPVPAYTPRTIVDPDAFKQEITRIRQDGFALDRCERTSTYAAIAVPVRLGEGRAIAALQTGGSPELATEQKLLDLANHCKALAAELSLDLVHGD